MRVSQRECPLFPHLEQESNLGYPGVWVAGVDEVGRGCLAGPVVAAALVLPLEALKPPWIHRIRDSKLLKPGERQALVPLILEWAQEVQIAAASVEEIDELNIFHASHLAMQRAVSGLQCRPGALLVDGKFLPQEGFSGVPVVRAVIAGDRQCLSIAAASIVAKEWRDDWMRNLSQEFPAYGFDQHKGYPTPFHQQAILDHGVIREHRRSFKRIRCLVQ